MVVYAYVDGESHFFRSEAAWRKRHGEEAALEDISHPNSSGSGPFGGYGPFYPDSKTPLIRIERSGKFFWDTSYPQLVRPPLSMESIKSAVYYTDFSGGEIELQEVRVSIRRHGFDPQVIKESTQLVNRREHFLTTQGILEKPKGVDIGLTVRLLEDAHRNVFDVCYLFTSDVDYMPVIGAMQRMGRKVVVFGYKDGLGANSLLEYGPDAFIELGKYMETYRLFFKAGA